MISTMLVEDMPAMYETQCVKPYMREETPPKSHTYKKIDFNPPVSLQSLNIVLEKSPCPPACETPAPKIVSPNGPTAQPPSDVDLTCLNWLQNLKLMNGASLPTPPISPEPTVGNTIAGPPTPPMEPEEPAVDYRYVSVKPPYSYAQLICMAMAANENIMTLSAIYSWIRENFLYYQLADPAWHNSIRHNLSLNKSFIKVPRGKDEPGKGGFWRLDTSSSAGPCMFTRKRKATSSRRFRPRRVRNAPVQVTPAECPISAVLSPENSTPIFSEEELSTTWLSSNWNEDNTDFEFLDAILDNFDSTCTEPCLTGLE